MFLIPATHGYYIEKVYEGISSDHPLGSVNLDMIKQTHQNIKDGISQRYGGEDVLESTKLITDKIDYVLGNHTDAGSAGYVRSNGRIVDGREGSDVPCCEWFSGFLHTVYKTASSFICSWMRRLTARAFSTSALRCDSARAIPFAGENSARERR